MQQLADASDFVALLTPTSFNRPWILFEAGVAKSKMDSTVFGIALGIPLDVAISGPFLLFQNCDDDESALTTLTIQLIKKNNPDTDPIEDDVRQRVALFREKVHDLLPSPADLPKPRGPDESIRLLETKMAALETSSEVIVNFIKNFGPKLEGFNNSHPARRPEESVQPNE
jgi:hypothetical protein